MNRRSPVLLHITMKPYCDSINVYRFVFAQNCFKDVHISCYIFIHAEELYRILKDIFAMVRVELPEYSDR